MGEWSTPRSRRCTAGKYPVPIVQEAGWAPGPVWTGAENLALHPPEFDPRTVQAVASRYTPLRYPTLTHCDRISFFPLQILENHALTL